MIKLIKEDKFYIFSYIKSLEINNIKKYDKRVYILGGDCYEL